MKREGERESGERNKTPINRLYRPYATGRCNKRRCKKFGFAVSPQTTIPMQNAGAVFRQRTAVYVVSDATEKE